MTNDPLIDDIYLCMQLLRMHARPQYWYREFVHLTPVEHKQRIAVIDAELKVLAGVDSTLDRALTRQCGTTDLNKIVSDERLADIINDPISASVYNKVSPSDIRSDSSSNDAHERIMRELVFGLNESLQHPANCAQILSRRSLVDTSLPFTREMSSSLAQQCYARGWGDGIPSDPSLRRHYRTLSQFFDCATAAEVDPIEYHRRGFGFLFDLCRVGDRHPLYATSYALFVPPQRSLILSNPIDRILVECSQRPDVIRRLTSRQFEQFLAKIFEAFGFEVELTAETRDGGSDLICMSYKHGISFKLAVEAKRYAPDRPITVELVRSFVGANSAIRANKLIYVTTSRYTRAAQEFAKTPWVNELLELKATPDIIRWSEEVIAGGCSGHL